MPDVTAADRGHGTRERLLRAAAELIVEVGWGEVSTRAVAQRAGVPTGAVHYHYSSVQDLLRAAVAPHMRALVGELTAGLAEAPDIPAGVEGLVAGVAQHTAGSAEAVLLAEVVLQASRDSTLRREVAGVLADLRAELARWLTGHGYGDRAGPAATVLTAALDALGMHRAIDPDLDLDGVAAALVNVVERTKR